MNDHAKAWVAALRSGEFDQTQRKLYDGADGYCCLGVACELFRREAGDEWLTAYEDEEQLVQLERPAYHGMWELLPDDVQRWLGLSSENGSFGDGIDDLAARNDGGATFEEIANIIESEPEGLFA